MAKSTKPAANAKPAQTAQQEAAAKTNAVINQLPNEEKPAPVQTPEPGQQPEATQEQKGVENQSNAVPKQNVPDDLKEEALAQSQEFKAAISNKASNQAQPASEVNTLEQVANKAGEQLEQPEPAIKVGSPLYPQEKVEQEDIDQLDMLKYAGVVAGDTHEVAHEKIITILKAHYDQTHKSEHPDQFVVSLDPAPNNDNYVDAERKHPVTGIKETMRFTKTTWDMLKNSREGWKKAVATPPEVQNLKKG